MMYVALRYIGPRYNGIWLCMTHKWMNPQIFHAGTDDEEFPECSFNSSLATIDAICKYYKDRFCLLESSQFWKVIENEYVYL